MVYMATIVYSRRIDSDTPDMAVSYSKSVVAEGHPSAKLLLCAAEDTLRVTECAEVGRMARFIYTFLT
jgi:hypothetical protein